MPLSPKDIKSDLDQVETDATFYRKRQDINSKVRYSRWDGQAEDGRKHEANIGQNPFPFEGASDARVRFSEIITNAETRILKTAFKRSKLRVKGTEVTDWGQANVSTTVLDWMVNSQMRRAYMEAGLCAEWRQEKGAYAMRIDWHQETGLETDEITMLEIEQLAMESPEVAELQMLIMDGGLDEEAAQILVQFNDSLTEKQAQKAVKSLREDGIATFDVPYFRVNRPRWTALRIYRDVYFPTYVDDIQKSPWVAERKYYTEEEINEKELSEGWSKAFIKEVLKHKGDKSLDHWSTQDRNKFGRQFSYEETVEDQEDLYEIYHVYYKENDSSNAIGIYTYAMTYFSEDVQSQKAELLDYDHGLYPFVMGVREYTERGIIQSRGIGELLQTQQGEVKIQRDNAVDRTSLDTVPPLLVPASRSDLTTILGPAVQIPVRRPGEIEPLVLPQTAQNTQFIIEQVMQEVNPYFGRDPNDPEGNLLYKQQLVDDFLAEIEQIYDQTFALMQQFMPDLETSIVTGGALESINATREEIQGKYNFCVQFDARDMDLEMVQKKMDFWSNMRNQDSEGIIQSTPLIRRAAEWMDPIGASEIIATPAQAGQKEFNKAQEVLTKIFAGVEPPPPDENTAAQLQLQVIQQSLQSNPQLIQRYQQDEIYKGMVDAYVQGLQFQVQQDQNAVIGRTGTQPFLDSMGNAS